LTRSLEYITREKKRRPNQTMRIENNRMKTFKGKDGVHILDMPSEKKTIYAGKRKTKTSSSKERVRSKTGSQAREPRTL